MVAALQFQVTHHFSPAWGITADLNFITKGRVPRKKAWQIVILDNSDQAGALGYHDMTKDGLPIGKVFAKTDQRYGLKWSVTASHEILEMLCLGPTTRVLKSDLRWTPIENISLGDKLVGFDENVRGTQRFWRTSIVEDIQEVVRPCYRLVFEDGTEIIASEEHKWLARNGTTSHWIQTHGLRAIELDSHYRSGRKRERGAGSSIPSRVCKPVSVWGVPDTYEAGYIAAALEGEGCIAAAGAARYGRLMFSQADNVMLKRMREFLSASKIRFTENLARRRNPKHKDCYRLYISHKSDVMKVLGSTRPLRLLQKFDSQFLGAMYGLNSSAVRLKAKEFIGDRKVVAMRTSTGTFLAEGFASHNCDPNINLTVLREDIGQLWAYEVADSPESEEFSYTINGVAVSDFVFPEWFEGFWPINGTQFDYGKHIDRPFKLLPGGYIGYYDLRYGNGWQQLTENHAQYHPKLRPPVGSRRERRRIRRRDWVASTQ